MRDRAPPRRLDRILQVLRPQLAKSRQLGNYQASCGGTHGACIWSFRPHAVPKQMIWFTAEKEILNRTGLQYDNVGSVAFSMGSRRF
jgi:hypothetical protein